MKILKINADNPEKEKIKEAISVLKRGGTVVYPTDTVYGIGANIFDAEATQKVYQIKKRSYSKPISACVSKIQNIHKIAHMDKNTEKNGSKNPSRPIYSDFKEKRECTFHTYFR